MQTHEFTPDPADPAFCAEPCGMPKANRRHNVAGAAAAALRSATVNYTHTSPNATDKSNEAGLRALPTSGSIKAKLLDAICRVDPQRGMTDSELFAAFPDIGQSSVRPRRIDLRADGWLEPVLDENYRQVTRGGFTAWRLSPAGRAQWKPSEEAVA